MKVDPKKGRSLIKSVWSAKIKLKSADPTWHHKQKPSSHNTNIKGSCLQGLLSLHLPIKSFIANTSPCLFYRRKKLLRRKKSLFTCFDTKDAKGNNERTVFVTGLLAVLGMRSGAHWLNISVHAESWRGFLIPFECESGVSWGHAFINLKKRSGDIEAALTLNGSDLGGRKLLVTMAKSRKEFCYHNNFKGCEICRAMFAAGRRELYRRNAKTQTSYCDYWF